jgi:hypothetical protein
MRISSGLPNLSEQRLSGGIGAAIAPARKAVKADDGQIILESMDTL